MFRAMKPSLEAKWEYSLIPSEVCLFCEGPVFTNCIVIYCLSVLLIFYVVGDGPNLRNFVLAHGALGPLLGIIQPGINVRKYQIL